MLPKSTRPVYTMRIFFLLVIHQLEDTHLSWLQAKNEQFLLKGDKGSTRYHVITLWSLIRDHIRLG